MVKLIKVLTQTIDMSLEKFVRQLNIWQASKAYVSDSTQFQDLKESLKLNKVVKGLAKYVSKHVL